MNYSKTFAFSNRFDKWTTRYSFTPTCYGAVDNHFISANNGKVWQHDVNPKRCNFYGESDGCGLTVASNQDPSAIKVFNSLSLETNSNKWTAKIKANEEKGIQSGSVKQQDWKNKEGFLYADMPKSVNNSSSNIVPCPSPVVLETVPSGTALNGVSFSVLLPFTPNISLPLSANTRVYVLEDGNLINPGTDINLNVGFEMTATGFATSPLGTVITFEFIASNQNPVSLVNQFKNALTNSDYSFYEKSLFLVSPANINGDNIRGSYVKMELIDDSEEAVQINAVNVDYQFSKLDARLTQNT
jgi:hypothetical protein